MGLKMSHDKSSGSARCGVIDYCSSPFHHPDSGSLSAAVSEAFVRFFVEMVGHYSLFMGGADREDDSVSSPTLPGPSSSPSSSFQREAFCKAVTSKSLKRFLEVFMETQMFTSFIQERELRRQSLRGTLQRCYNTANSSF